MHELAVDGAKAGVPQTRKRIILVAWLARADFNLEIPHVCGGTLTDAIGAIPNVRQTMNLLLLHMTSLMALIAQRIRPGQKLSMLERAPDRFILGIYRKFWACVTKRKARP